MTVGLTALDKPMIIAIVVALARLP